MKPCNQRRSHSCRAKFIVNFWGRSAGNDVLATSGNEAGYVKQEEERRSTWVKKLLGAAAVAAIAYAFVPAHAAKVGIGCSGESLAKAEGPAETMPDGPAKFTAQREIAAAQDA